MPLNTSSTDEEILAEVEGWISDLANEDYEGALNRVTTDPYQNWSPELLEAVIAGYGLPKPHPSGIVFRVTPMPAAASGPPRRWVARQNLPEGALAYVEHDLPLNGEWSDLTATFVLRGSGKVAVLELNEVHVF